MQIASTGSSGPFEMARLSVYRMAMGIFEASIVENILKDPTPENLEILASYLMTDPSIKEDKDLPS
tara:strand:+ start:181 stop:378 length:198 start_codon:yes stop_codon:yes gene_type:complete